MGFNEAQFQAAVDQINSGLRELGNKINEVPAAANAALNNWYIPGFVKDAIVWLAETLTDLARSIMNKIIEVMKGVAAPVYFFRYAFDWQDIRGLANGVAGQLNPAVLTATQTWTGAASTAYGRIIAPQGAAASKIASISDKTATALQICAAAGLAFYVAIGAILVKFIAAMVTAIAAFGSAVFSWAGAALIVEEAGVNSGLIWAAIGALTAALGTQAQQMISLHGESIDNSTFPGGHWPDPTTRLYNDGTVTDGDADWSLAR
jgi:hypothetical protein